MRTTIASIWLTGLLTSAAVTLCSYGKESGTLTHDEPALIVSVADSARSSVPSDVSPSVGPSNRRSEFRYQGLAGLMKWRDSRSNHILVALAFIVGVTCSLCYNIRHRRQQEVLLALAVVQAQGNLVASAQPIPSVIMVLLGGLLTGFGYVFFWGQPVDTIGWILMVITVLYGGTITLWWDKLERSRGSHRQSQS